MIEIVFGKMDMEKAYELAKALPDLEEVEISAILAALEAKGYDSEILAGFAKAILEKSSINLGKVFDTCGTGGDNSKTINVSTAIAIALANFTRVAKHGNRAMSSKSGSADVLEKLGFKIDLPPEKTEKLISETNFAFLFAPIYHKSFLRVAAVRKKLKIRTIFNVLGPIVNPANPKKQIIGVSNEPLLYIVAEVLELLGREGIVYYGNGLDEVSPNAETTAIFVENGLEKIIFTPEDFGIERTRIIPCNSSEESAERIKAVFSGRGFEEDKKLLAINFALALNALGYENLRENVSIFEEYIENGKIARKLEEIICKSMILSNL
ncbi:MAG: anthranilate phosphoribosyltransferase [Archaeoglobaceae archaeon]